MNLLIVTGLSGAGKSLAMHALEDIGFFCIDNIPANLLAKLMEFAQQSENTLERVAVVLDIRGGKSSEDILNALGQLKAGRVNYKILFLDARNDVLERRYKETRRRHPISIASQVSTDEAILQEREILAPLYEMADYKIDTSYMFPEFRDFCDSLNNISAGMQNAVDEKMKSERMRTELITNVSHDIKTPLTSIINYVDLIKKEQPENEKIKEYVAVLDRQSSRLKKLIEDLVEASKASSGSLKVELSECDAGVLLSQTVGEFDERLKNAELTPVLTIPDMPVKIMADGRHLWRVLENLTGNVCKYSLPGTRVYMDLTVRDKKAVITFKNISKYPLNISGDELMERFVRGDTSRNTEGSGLGLSIARSLTELQGGDMKIDIDGDLFKAALEFDLINAT